MRQVSGVRYQVPGRVVMVMTLVLLCSSCIKKVKPEPVKPEPEPVTEEVPEKRVYYYAAGQQGHPYFLDMHLGFRYAAQKFGVEIRTVGPQGRDRAAQVEALEEAVAAAPDGIITIMHDESGKPAVRRAMEQGIPVIVVEAMVPDHGAMCFIGLDNYASGKETAKELIRLAGDSGEYVVSGNWGASDTDMKYRGLTDYLVEHSEWEEIGRVDDRAATEEAIKAAVFLFETYGDADAVIGLDASSGTGIGIAIEDLGLDPEEYTVIVHGREEPVLNFIAEGIVDATIINKTALCAYMAIQLLEAYNDDSLGMANVPIANNNLNANIKPFPDFIYMGTEVINRSNVFKFMPENIPQYR